MKGFGGCFALELSTEAAAKALPGALKLFRSATSLGGVEPWIPWILEGVAKLMATNPATWLFNWIVWLFRPGAEHADDGGWYRKCHRNWIRICIETLAFRCHLKKRQSIVKGCMTQYMKRLDQPGEQHSL